MTYEEFKEVMLIIADLGRKLEEADPYKYDPLPDAWVDFVTKHPKHYKRFLKEN